MNILKKFFLVFSLTILPILTPIVFLFARQAGLFLLVSDPLPKQIDLIFTFGSEPPRKQFSLELALRYTNAHWIISDHQRTKTIRWLTENDISLKRVTIVDTCTSTFSEISLLNNFLRDVSKLSYCSLASKEDRIRTIALVSSPFHMRRISLLASNVLPQKITINYLPVPFSISYHTFEQYVKWWRHKQIRRIIRMEYLKIGYDLFRSLAYRISN